MAATCILAAAHSPFTTLHPGRQWQVTFRRHIQRVQSIGWSDNRLYVFRQQHGQSASQSASRPASQSASQSASHPASQSASQSASHPAGPWRQQQRSRYPGIQQSCQMQHQP
jgi:hypothetical protein